jgi:hypothetical protein
MEEAPASAAAEEEAPAGAEVVEEAVVEEAAGEVVEEEEAGSEQSKEQEEPPAAQGEPSVAPEVRSLVEEVLERTSSLVVEVRPASHSDDRPNAGAPGCYGP